MFKICPCCSTRYEYSKECPNNCKDKTKKQRYKDYNKYVRDKDKQSFYNSVEWRRLREYVMIKYNCCCVYSLIVEGKVIPADVVHHCLEYGDYKDLGLCEEYLIPLCHDVHNRLHTNYTEDIAKELLEIKSKYDELY